MRIAAAVVLGLLAAPAAAQTSGIPPEVAAKIRQLGAVLNPPMIQAMFEAYAPLQPPRPADVEAMEDFAYGADDRQRLDVFFPAKRPGRPAPVVLVVPGGGYVGGAKSRPGIPFYQNIGIYFAHRGVIGVNINYRLAPAHGWPAGGEDVAAALAWVRRNIGEFGGDYERVFLWGQSAGATHVAHYLFDEGLQLNGGRDGVIGAILQSGIYDPAAMPPAPNLDAYFGAERSRWAARAPVGMVPGRRVPVFLVTAEFDPPEFKAQGALLREALCRRDGACPRTRQLAGHNHLSQVLHLNTADQSLVAELSAFMREPE